MDIDSNPRVANGRLLAHALRAYSVSRTPLLILQDTLLLARCASHLWRCGARMERRSGH